MTFISTLLTYRMGALTGEVELTAKSNGEKFDKSPRPEALLCAIMQL